MSLTPLATSDDVAARLGRDLTSQESARCAALLTDMSALIRRYCRRDFLMHADETETYRAHGSKIILPDQTTISVSAVVALGGNENLPDLAIPWFTFDDIDTIRLWPLNFVVNLPEVWREGEYPGTYDVTRTFGYADVPDEVVSVCATAVIGVLTSPSQAAGLIGETIGPYSYRLERGGGGSGVALSQADMAALKDYRLTQATIETRHR